MVNMADLMVDPDLGARPLTLRRPTGQFANEGEFEMNYQDTAIVGLIQPATPREIEMLHEGTRVGNVIHVWSATEIRCSDGKAAESDVLVITGDMAGSYRVIKANPWTQAGFSDVFAEGFVTS